MTHLTEDLREFDFDGYVVELTVCYYCGAPAETVDHVPPRSIRPFILENPQQRQHYPFYEVNCCKECNCRFLGTKGWTLAERKKHVAQQIKRKYRRLLAMPDWTPEELQGMSMKMKTQIRANLKKRDNVRERLRWAEQEIS